MQLIKDSFNSTDKNKFITKFIESLTSTNLIPAQELPYFKLYLSKIKTIDPFCFNSVSDYILSYIYPNLLVSSNDL